MIVGGRNEQVLTLNCKALSALTCEKLMRIVPGATHLFEESGALEAVDRDGNELVPKLPTTADNYRRNGTREEATLSSVDSGRAAKNVPLIGFGTHCRPNRMRRRNQIRTISRSDNYESLSHDVGVERFLLDLRSGQRNAPPRADGAATGAIDWRDLSARYLGGSHYSRLRLTIRPVRCISGSIRQVRSFPASGEDETYPFGL